jgi:hypothetical protein
MNRTLKIVTGGLMAAFLTLQVSAQAPMKTLDEGGKKPNKLDTAVVPQPVRAMYYTDYPGITVYEWYSYPSFTDDSGWYDTDSDMYLSTEGMPEYYIVEFNKDETPQRTVYSKTGKKVSVHKAMKKNALPMAVSNAFNKSKYKSWKEIGEKVEIMKDADKTKAYKITVTDGKEKHALFYDEKGKMLKDKKIKM